MTDLLDFSQRELRILNLLCDGKTDKEIAFGMGTTRGHAQNLVNALVHRLGARNRVEAAVKYTMLCMQRGSKP